MSSSLRTSFFLFIDIPIPCVLSHMYCLCLLISVFCSFLCPFLNALIIPNSNTLFFDKTFLFFKIDRYQTRLINHTFINKKINCCPSPILSTRVFYLRNAYKWVSVIMETHHVIMSKTSRTETDFIIHSVGSHIWKSLIKYIRSYSAGRTYNFPFRIVITFPLAWEKVLE